jgi:hypothetical protein
LYLLPKVQIVKPANPVWEIATTIVLFYSENLHVLAAICVDPSVEAAALLGGIDQFLTILFCSRTRPAQSIRNSRGIARAFCWHQGILVKERQYRLNYRRLGLAELQEDTTTQRIIRIKKKGLFIMA